VYGELLLTEPLLLHNGELTCTKVIARKHDEHGNPVGIFNRNPLLNMRIYIAEFPDGHITEMSANIISEAIYNQLDDDGVETLLFFNIVGHEQDETALKKIEMEAIRDNRKKMAKMYKAVKGFIPDIPPKNGTPALHGTMDQPHGICQLRSRIPTECNWLNMP
jgi:hypothetical protein